MLVNVSSARANARDALRRADVRTLYTAIELRFNSEIPEDNGIYITSDGVVEGIGTVDGNGDLLSGSSLWYNLIYQLDLMAFIPCDPSRSQASCDAGGATGYMHYRYTTHLSGNDCDPWDAGHAYHSPPEYGDKFFAVYTTLENPTANDLATIKNDFDLCVKEKHGKNYRVGNR